jgi:hypothetical protein
MHRVLAAKLRPASQKLTGRRGGHSLRLERGQHEGADPGRAGRRGGTKLWRGRGVRGEG